MHAGKPLSSVFAGGASNCFSPGIMQLLLQLLPLHKTADVSGVIVQIAMKNQPNMVDLASST